MNGVWADGSLEAARIARMATQAGASALLVFPPAPFTMGQTAEMALAHFKRIADASDLPIIVFQYPLATGQGYPGETLLRLAQEVPTIAAIKDWAGNVPQHEMHIRMLQTPAAAGARAHHPQRLAAELAGARLQRAPLRQRQRDRRSAGAAVSRRAGRRLAAARRLNDRIYPLARVFYAEPWADMHNRMKEALVLLGRLPRAVVRPPLVKLGGAEIDRIQAALVEAGLLAAKAGRDAA